MGDDKGQSLPARKNREKLNNVNAGGSGGSGGGGSGASKKRKANSGKAAGERKCYNCDEAGHIASACPKPQSEKTKAYMAAKAKKEEKA